MIRAQVGDVDLGGGVVTLREKKRVKGRETTRRVPLTPLLEEVLKAWLADHPGGNNLGSSGVSGRWPAAIGVSYHVIRTYVGESEGRPPGDNPLPASGLRRTGPTHPPGTPEEP
jgi:hypothetical protein